VKAGSLGAIVRAYKSAVTYAINKLENSRGAAVWQRNYYEHVIRNEKELNVTVPNSVNLKQKAANQIKRTKLLAD
jgi:hypothetical protein